LHLPPLEGNTLNVKIEQGAINFPPELHYVLTPLSKNHVYAAFLDQFKADHKEVTIKLI